MSDGPILIGQVDRYGNGGADHLKTANDASWPDRLQSPDSA